MKKLIILAILLTIAICFLTYKIYFPKQDNKEDNTTTFVNDTEENDQNSDQKEDTSEFISTENDKDSRSDNIDTEGVFKMLDFDRRLILKVGQQDDYTCSIYCLAYARAILYNNSDVDPYDYWNDGAVWSAAEFTDLASTNPLDKVLKTAYEQLNKGRPVIIYTSGIYAATPTEKPQQRSADEHFVLLIGYKLSADPENLRPSDFYGADPAAGYKSTEENYIPWIILTDEAPELMLDEYALFAPVDENIHVNTCLAYADTVRWDADLSEAIHPDYVKNTESE